MNSTFDKKSVQEVDSIQVIPLKNSMSKPTTPLFREPVHSHIPNQNFSYTMEENAIVYVYRPAKLIGFGWVFHLKSHGKTILKIPNGSQHVLKLPAGRTRFKIKRKTVEIDLRPGKVYYLKASLINGIPIGRPHLEEVTKETATVDFDR